MHIHRIWKTNPILNILECFSKSSPVTNLLAKFLLKLVVNFPIVGLHKMRYSHMTWHQPRAMCVQRGCFPFSQRCLGGSATYCGLCGPPREADLEQVYRRAMTMTEWLEDCLSEERSQDPGLFSVERRWASLPTYFKDGRRDRQRYPAVSDLYVRW